MDGQSLVTAVEFDEVKKGYDPEQVENYLEQLGERLTLLATNLRKAVDRAEVAEARATAALKERDAAREQAEAAERRAPTSGGDDGTESIKKMLMLAQRTADSAVEEAQASAKNIVADARSKAAEIVGDAEQRAERLLIEAQKVGDEMMQEKSAAIVKTVSELEARRDALLSDTSSLSRHLEEHRARLASALSSLRAVADEAGALRVDPTPVLEVPLDAIPADEIVGGADPAPVKPALADVLAADDRPPGGTGSAGGGGTASPAAGGPSVVPVSSNPVAKPAPGPAPSASAGTVPITPTEAGDGRAGRDESPQASLLVAERDVEAHERGVRSAALIEAPIAPARPPLFDAELEAPELDLARDTRELTSTERESLFSDGDPLGPTDDQSDEAMRRFFEGEVADDSPKRRFRKG